MALGATGGEMHIIGRPIASSAPIPVRPRPYLIISASPLARPDPITGGSKARASPATYGLRVQRRGVHIRHPYAYREMPRFEVHQHGSGVHHRRLGSAADPAQTSMRMLVKSPAGAHGPIISRVFAVPDPWLTVRFAAELAACTERPLLLCDASLTGRSKRYWTVRGSSSR